MPTVTVVIAMSTVRYTERTEIWWSGNQRGNIKVIMRVKVAWVKGEKLLLELPNECLCSFETFSMIRYLNIPFNQFSQLHT